MGQLKGCWVIKGLERESEREGCFFVFIISPQFDRRGFLEAFISLSRRIIEHLHYDMIYTTDKLFKAVSRDRRALAEADCGGVVQEFSKM